MGCLLYGVIGSLAEFAQKSPFPVVKPWQGWTALGASVLLWMAWSVVFARATRQDAPQDIVSRLCRQLLAGSILSLLIAVPTHIVAHHRNYCCAGFGTFVGIVFGLAVLLVAFGPGMFFLYAARWKKLHPDMASGTESRTPDIAHLILSDLL